jgi:tetratricopeptide (TPR) repeat protein
MPVEQGSSSPIWYERTWVPPVVLVCAVLAAYHNSFSGVFLLDDRANIVTNTAIHDVSTVLRDFTHDTRPIVTLTLALNYAVAGLEPWGYHAVNVGIHVLASLALFGLVRRTLLLPGLRDRFGASATSFALAISLLWALHPLQTQSVTYLIQRAQAFTGLFQFLTLYCLARADSSPRKGWWYVSAILSCAIGLGCKQDMVVTPLLAVAYDRIFLSGSWRGVMRRWWLHAALIATWVILARSFIWALGFAQVPAPSSETIDSSTPAQLPQKPTAGFMIERCTPLQYALTESEVILHYLRLAIWPNALCLDYFDWPIAQSFTEVLPALLVVLALLVVMFRTLYLRPELGFLGLWFFLALAPTSSIMPIDDVAFEHRMYIPLAPLIILLFFAGREVLKWLVATRRIDGRRAERLGAVTVAILAIGLMVLTISRNAEYGSAITIWQDAVRLRPANPRAQHNLAIALVVAERYPEGLAHMSEAVRLNPTPNDHALLAEGLAASGKLREAIPHFQAALVVSPHNPRLQPQPPPPPAELHMHLARIHVQLGEWDEALKHYQEVVRLQPRNVEAHIEMSWPLTQLADWPRAAETLEAALRLDPNAAIAHNNLGPILVRLGKPRDAIAHLLRASELDPNHGPTYNNLGAVYYREGQLSEATVAFRKGTRIQPGDASMAFGLAHALNAGGQSVESRQMYQRALRLDSQWPGSAARIAWELATHPEESRRDPPEAVRLAEQAVQATGERDPAILDVLAAAYAAAGRFTDAAAAAEKAIAAAGRRPDLQGAIKARLTLYQQNQAYRTQPASPKQPK